MRKFTIASAFMAVVFVFALGGCQGIATQSVDREALVGFWKLDSVAPVGFEAYLNLSEDDDVAELIVGDAIYEGKWSVDNGQATMELEGAEAVSIQFTGDKVMLGSNDGTRLLFAKGSVDEYLAGLEDEGESETDGESPADEEAAGEGAAAEDEAAEAGEGEAETEAEVEIVDEAISPIDPVTVADDATCTIVVTGRGTDFTADPCYRLTFQNKTDKTLFITAEEAFTVGDKPMGAGLGDTAEPGETVEVTMYFDKEELGGGLDLLANVNGTINVEVEETYEEVASYPFHMD